MYVRAQARPRGFNVELIVLSQRFQHLEVVKITLIPAANSATRQRQFRVLDHAVRVEILLNARPSQVGHAPAGLLNENRRGSSSRML